MRVILVQHGEAQPKQADPDRPLTERGREDVDALATRLGESGVLPRRIWHSGKTRARQSAELLSVGTAPQPREGLGPDDPTEPWTDALAEDGDDVMLVGHQPFVGKLAARLLSGREDGVTVGFAPASACCIERGEDGAWRLEWMLRPELLSGG